MSEESSSPIRPEVEADERVPFERIVRELGWTANTAKRYLVAAKRLLHSFPDPSDKPGGSRQQSTSGARGHVSRISDVPGNVAAATAERSHPGKKEPQKR